MKVLMVRIRIKKEGKKMKITFETERNIVKSEIEMTLGAAVGSDYSAEILALENENGVSLMDEIITGIDDGHGYNYGDEEIKNAIGRVLMKRLSI